jgi:hypothetical protein
MHILTGAAKLSFYLIQLCSFKEIVKQDFGYVE